MFRIQCHLDKSKEGEKFPIHLLHMLQMKTWANIYNMYGPTETTIWSTVSNLTNKKEVNIGFPNNKYANLRFR